MTAKKVTAATETEPPAPPLPEVRQQNDPERDQYGSTATKGSGITEGRWGVMNSTNGGHWATDDEVKDWTPLA